MISNRFTLQTFIFSIVLHACFLSIKSENDTRSLYCASIFTEKHFQGFRLDMSSESRWNFRGHLNLIPNSVKVAANKDCALTIFDGKGNIQTMNDNTPALLNWPAKRPVHLSCCQCGQCDVIKKHASVGCARIYQYEKCSACIGAFLDMKDNQEITDFGLIHDRLASVALRDGCQLRAMYEVTKKNLKILMTATLQNGDNLIESPQGIFNEEARIHIKRAVCTCSNTHSTGAFGKPHLAIDDIVFRRPPPVLEQNESEVEMTSSSKEGYDEGQQRNQSDDEEEDMWLIY